MPTFNAAYWTQKKAEERIKYDEPRRAGAKAAADMIHAHEADYKLHRDKIIKALVDVMTNRWYQHGRYDTFRQWFDAQGFTFAYHTALWYIREYRSAQGDLKRARPLNVEKKPLECWARVLQSAIKAGEKAYKADPDPAWDKLVRTLRNVKAAVDSCLGAAHAAEC